MRDWRLIRRYSEDQSQVAFTQLTERYTNLVYSTCCRELGDAHLSEDATQAVFLLLARKAPTLRREVVLSGWLFQAARLTARNIKRQELRHGRAQEKATAEMLRIQEVKQIEALADPWGEIEPYLNDAISSLKPQERNLLLLRFFEDQSLAEISQTLGLSEDAARMRVTRALEKIRRFLSRSGVTVPTAVLAGLLSARAVKAAPVACIAVILEIGSVGTSIVAATGTGVGASALALEAALPLLRREALRTIWAARIKGTAVIVGTGIAGFITTALVVDVYSGHMGTTGRGTDPVSTQSAAHPFPAPQVNSQTLMMSELQPMAAPESRLNTLVNHQLSEVQHMPANMTDSQRQQWQQQQQQAMLQETNSIFQQQWVVVTRKIRLPNGKITSDTSYSVKVGENGGNMVHPPPGPDISLIPGAKILSITTRTVPTQPEGIQGLPTQRPANNLSQSHVRE